MRSRLPSLRICKIFTYLCWRLHGRVRAKPCSEIPRLAHGRRESGAARAAVVSHGVPLGEAGWKKPRTLSRTCRGELPPMGTFFYPYAVRLRIIECNRSIRYKVLVWGFRAGFSCLIFVMGAVRETPSTEPHCGLLQGPEGRRSCLGRILRHRYGVS